MDFLLAFRADGLRFASAAPLSGMKPLPLGDFYVSIFNSFTAPNFAVGDEITFL